MHFRVPKTPKIIIELDDLVSTGQILEKSVLWLILAVKFFYEAGTEKKKFLKSAELCISRCDFDG